MVYQSNDAEADAKFVRDNIVEESEIKKPTEVIETTAEIKKAEPIVEVLSKTDITPLNKDVDEVVESIVSKWNELVTVVQNTTIGLCLMIKEMTKDYPDDTIKDVLIKVKQHPNIKRFVSIDRIWQGMRLINKRNDLIEYMAMEPEAKQELSEEKKPYLKKDGEIFWEFYFELAKQPMSDQTIMMLELDGKNENWSFRQLREKIQEIKEETDQPLGYADNRREKGELLKKIIAISKVLPVDRLRGILTLCQDFQKENIGIKKESKEE